ncbi:MAG TPA: NBR1-Ig-like domain-containing protein [Anaerolineales bacterium]|nr:NBR1-Ig-like domain-containing protein [Anaerolineales bacterium]
MSCDATTLIAPAPAASPLPPQSIDTIVVQTAGAASTQTAAVLPPTLTPTITPLPTRTFTVTPPPSPTFVFLLATLTRTPPTAEPSSKDFACALTDQSPQDGSSISKNQTFAVTWTVKNTGSSTWDSNTVDFSYASGAKLSPLKAVDLPKTVPSGDSLDLKLTMVAPSSADTYRTVWTLEAGKDPFCRLDVTIVVK